MNDSDKKNAHHLVLMGQEMFALLYLDSTPGERQYIDRILKQYADVLVAEEIQCAFDDLMDFESVGEDENNVEFDVSDAKRELARIMDL